jgi:adenylate cyclase
LELQLWDVNVARLSRTSPTNAEAEDLAIHCMATIWAMRPDYSLCERGLQIDPRNVRALIGVAWKSIEPWAAGTQSGDAGSEIRQADELVKQALDIDPNYYLAHSVKGWVLLAQKRVEEASVEFERSLALNPAFIDNYNNLAIASNVLGRPEKAIEYADKAIRLSPRDPAVWLWYSVRGIGYFQLQKDDQAITSLRRSVTLCPSTYPSTWNQAFLLAALALNGHQTEANETLGRYLASQDNRPKTIARWRLAVQAYTDNPVWLASGERFYEGLRKAGMPEE